MSMEGYNSSHSGEEFDASIDEILGVSKSMKGVQESIKELLLLTAKSVLKVGAGGGDASPIFGLGYEIKELKVVGANGITTYIERNATGTAYNLVIDASLVQTGTDEEEVKSIIQQWLHDHPEATTTIADGSITMAKLSADLKTVIDNAGSVKDVNIYINEEEVSDTYINYEYGIILKDASGKILAQDIDTVEIEGATSSAAGLMTATQVRNLASALTSINSLRIDLNWLTGKVQDIEEGGAGLSEAPSDSKLYGRINGEWQEITEETWTAKAKYYADKADGASVAAQEAEDNAKYWSSDARESMDYAKQAKTDIVNIIKNLDDETKSETDIRQDAEIESLKKQVGTPKGLSILQTDQADLAFGDKNGNSIVSFTDHIRTKSFDSRNAATKAYVQNYVATHGTGGITQEQMNAIVQMVLQQIGGNSGGAIEDNLELGRASVKNRADQWRLVKWYALNTLQSALGSTISTGQKTGLLYTSCMNVDKFVGYDVSLLTYMTAANNPYSMFYTENLKKKTSGYGFSYDYKNVRATMGAYMGIVCNIFALNAVGCEIPWDTGSWDYCVQMGIMSLPADQTASGVEVGDLIWEQGHGRVVTAIAGSGTSKTIEIQESIQDFPVINEPNKNNGRTALTVSQFNTFMQTHKLYRYNGLGKNRYKASPFIALNDETPQTYNYNNDICTFAGDYVSFRQGQKIFLNYDLKSDGGWTQIELYKDGNLYGTYEKDTQHSIDLTSLNLTYGKYKARMKNGTTYSDYTYFEILQANMAVSNSGDTYTMTFDSINARPLYLRICKDNGGPYATYALTNTDIEQGKLVLNIRELINSQYGNIEANNVYAKIAFVGEYGRVTNEPEKLNY